MKKHLLAFLAFICCVVPAFSQNDAGKPYYAEDKIDAQILEAGKAIQLEPNNPQLYLKRAHLYRLKQNAEAVSSDVTKALGLSPDDISIQFDAVRLLYEFPGKCQQALAIINSAIANNPKNDEAFDWRFRVKTCLGDLVGALDDINTAISLNPQNSGYKNNQASLQQRLGQTDNAVENFNQWIASLEQKLKAAKDTNEKENLKRELMMTYFSRSRIFAKNENFEAMLADLNRAVEVNPTHYAYQIRARAYKGRKMYAEAVADLTKAIELNAEDAGLLMDRGDVYFLMRKFPEAIADYERILKINTGMERLAEMRISAAKQKMQENVNQPK
ncbi:MAG TPA: tetratricopeptide repeat protein [Pyrinomonadaceae bacterium]|nr:tetratricopeptide repeat protein [Pyrinomonadaceae bacterium]